MLSFAEISGRVDALRREGERRLAVDRLAVLELNAKLMGDPDAPLALRQKASIDIAKLQGYYEVERMEVRHEVSGYVEQARGPAVNPDTLERPQAYVAEIMAIPLPPEAYRRPGGGATPPTPSEPVDMPASAVVPRHDSMVEP